MPGFLLGDDDDASGTVGKSLEHKIDDTTPVKTLICDRVENGDS